MQAWKVRGMPQNPMDRLCGVGEVLVRFPKHPAALNCPMLIVTVPVQV